MYRVHVVGYACLAPAFTIVHNHVVLSDLNRCLVRHMILVVVVVIIIIIIIIIVVVVVVV